MAKWGLSKRQKLILVVLLTGAFITILNQTVVTPATPPIMNEMGIDAALAQWLTTGFTLVNAIMIPVTAWLIDKFPTRALFIVSMVIFAAGSALAGFAPTFIPLLGGRLLQAAGAGILMPMTMTVLMRMFPVERRGSAMGLFGLVIAFAPAIGPTLAGIVIDLANWRILFISIAVLSLLLVAVTPFVLKSDAPEHPDAVLDKTSVFLSTLGFGTLLYGFSAIGSYGLSIQALASSGVGAIALVFFFRRQLKMDEPMLQVRVLANRKFLIGTIIGMLVQASLLAAGVLIPIYLQTLMGYSATVSGLVILPGAILMGVMGPVAGRLFDKHGPRVLSLIGMTLLVATTFVFATLNSETDLIFMTAVYTVRMFSLTLVNMPITTWAMNALDDELINHGTSVNNTFRQMAGSLGTAILISVYTLSAAALAPFQGGLQANITGVNAAFAVGGVLCLIGLFMTIAFVKDKPGDRVVSEKREHNRTVLESIMQRDVYTIDSHATVLEAMHLLVEKGISAAPVVNSKGEPRGFVSDGDIMRHLSKRSQVYTDPILFIMRERKDDAEFDEKLERLMGMEVRDIATRGIIGVDIHDDLPTVCRVLGDNHLKKAPVLDDGVVVGVVNRSDLTQYSMRTYLERTNAL